MFGFNRKPEPTNAEKAKQYAKHCGELGVEGTKLGVELGVLTVAISVGFYGVIGAVVLGTEAIKWGVEKAGNGVSNGIELARAAKAKAGEKLAKFRKPEEKTEEDKAA